MRTVADGPGNGIERDRTGAALMEFSSQWQPSTASRLRVNYDPQRKRTREEHKLKQNKTEIIITILIVIILIIVIIIIIILIRRKRRRRGRKRLNGCLHRFGRFRPKQLMAAAIRRLFLFKTIKSIKLFFFLWYFSSLSFFFLYVYTNIFIYMCFFWIFDLDIYLLICLDRVV